MRTLNKHKGVLFFLIVGTVLRFWHLHDMEWKGDEQYLFNASQEFKAKGLFPSLGMPSSVGIKNPGLSVWLFLAIGQFTDTPIGMATGVALLNVLSLWGFFILILYAVPKEEYEKWLWGLALFSVSINPILHSRKIWQQNLLQPFMLLFFLGYLYRVKKTGSFLWGFIGALTGQIHLSGFFLTPVVFLWTFFRKRDSFSLTSWFFGSFIGGLPLIPWLQTLSFDSSTSPKAPIQSLFQFRFIGRWLEEVSGFSLQFHIYDLFKIGKFLNPFTCALYGLSFLLIVWGVVCFFREKRFKERGLLTSLLVPYLILYCSILTVLRIVPYPHYLIILYPFVHLSWAWILTKRQVICLALLQAALTASFLIYIHNSGGSVASDYGVTYQKQLDMSQ